MILLSITAICLSGSCTRTIVYVDQEPGTGIYLTGYPVGNAAPQLELIQKSIKRITSTTHFETYIFDSDSNIRPEQLASIRDIASIAKSIVHSHSTSSGTAIVIHNQDHNVGMITTRHVVVSPDTLFEFLETGQPYLGSVTIKKSQVNWLFDAPYVGNFEILVEDELADLAIIGARVDPTLLDIPVREQFPVFPYPFGRPDRLRIGTFTYNFGYPRGYPMITTAIVSQASRDRHHSFVTDGLFNPGFSGGAVVAINGGLPAFEWVGMARSTSASREWFMVPDDDAAAEHLVHLPYKGGVFVQEKAQIHYGITHVISITQIRKMLEDNAVYLLSRGYNILPFIQESRRR
jgi:S1-C subfamily serine protease